MRSQGCQRRRRVVRSRSSHALRTALTRMRSWGNPRPILHRGGLTDFPDARADTLAAAVEYGRSRFPSRGLVGNAVADLEAHRDEVVGPKFDLRSLLPGLPVRCGSVLPHGVPERVSELQPLAEHVRSTPSWWLCFTKASRRSRVRPRPASYLRWEHRAAVEVRPDTVGQVSTVHHVSPV